MIARKASGVSLPIFSLPDDYGIGTIGKGAKEFIDFLSASGFSYWSILPLMPTGYLDSPYSSIASRALNPYFIDLLDLVDKGLLFKRDINPIDWGEDKRKANYGKIYQNRIPVLKMAFKRFKKGKGEEYQRGYVSFLRKSRFLDYACFAVLKEQNKDVQWSDYQAPFNEYDVSSFREIKRKSVSEIEFRIWTQYIFLRQWDDLMDYAHEKNIRIIGEMPMFVSYDSIDVYKHRKNFLLNSERKMEKVAGYPQDIFYEKGQVWGSPLYNQEYLKKTNYRFLVERLHFNQRLYDVVMISSFYMVLESYALDKDAKDGMNGTWIKGPGKEILDVFNTVGDRLIAEDVGYHSEEMQKLLTKYRIPDIKVLEFAFLPSPSNPQSMRFNSPENSDHSSVSFSSTHDCNTLIGYFNSLSEEDRKKAWEEEKRLCQKLDVKEAKKEAKEMAKTALELNLASSSIIAIQAMNDILLQDENSRINVPSVANYNWRYRITREDLTKRRINELLKLNRKYQRTDK